NHNAFALNDHAMTLFRPRLHTRRRAALHTNFFGARVDYKPCAALPGVSQPSLGPRLFRSNRATVPAVAAQSSLVAPDHIARQSTCVPPEPLQPAFENPLAIRNSIVVAIDVQALADSVEAPTEFSSADPLHTLVSPFLTDIVWRTERGAVVDDGSAAQTFAC